MYADVKIDELGRPQLDTLPLPTRWLPFPKAAAQLLEAAREQDQQLVRYRVKPDSGWVCKFTGVQSTLDYVIDLPSMTQREHGSGLKRQIRRRISAPVPIFNLLDIEGTHAQASKPHTLYIYPPARDSEALLFSRVLNHPRIVCARMGVYGWYGHA